MFAGRNMIFPVAAAPGGGGGGGLLDQFDHYFDLDALTTPDLIGSAVLTRTNATLETANAPDGGNSLKFNTSGGGQYLSAAAGEIWATGSDMTISYWAKKFVSASGSYHFWHAAPGGYTHIWSLGGSTTAYLYVNGAYVGTVPSGLPNNTTTWFQVTITSAGGTTRVYIDGVLKLTVTATWQSGSGIFYFGRSLSGSTQYSLCHMCSLAIGTVELDQTQVTELYNSGVNLRHADF
jgi:hypothetical protein